MRRAERLFRLVQELRSRGVSRAGDLARHLEVSPRTVYRDIAHLQASGLPIEGEAGIGYLLRPGFDLPNVAFTHDQIAALAAGLSFVERNGDGDLALAAREVRAKLQAGMPQPEARVLADAPYFAVPRPAATPPHAAALRRAIRKRRVVLLSYADGAGLRSDRRLRPLALWTFAEGWMVTGWCELRQDFRTFRLDRIRSLTPTEETFAEEEDKSLALFLARDACHGPQG
ncbi:YafY family transcriptional regulator [Rhodobacter sp. SGA-6-6]|uniref:helix-turn-helix transcriptional regulator n=1 Tax=Rhodobacter sp. SGA-6-6 TaxID=2710882 RepID=UPI0013EA0EAD|nr:YafY family protein [Rhodobacter sp. SGA-6-6]NGM45021.1 YafY family transcriptional regulator [Rhodobacter sp. SGA-6-6]